MIDEADLTLLRGIFVEKDKCEKTRTESESHVQRLEIAMAKVGTKLSIMIGILGAIGISILSVIAKILFGG